MNHPDAVAAIAFDKVGPGGFFRGYVTKNLYLKVSASKYFTFEEKSLIEWTGDKDILVWEEKNLIEGH